MTFEHGFRYLIDYGNEFQHAQYVLGEIAGCSVDMVGQMQTTFAPFDIFNSFLQLKIKTCWLKLYRVKSLIFYEFSKFMKM